MNGKHFVMAHLIVLILLIVAFTPISSQQAGSYDPWLDYDGDGRINYKELYKLATSFGASGDPTRNVNITNLPLDAQGNLRTKLVQESKSMLVFNQSLGVLPTNGYIYITTVDVTGYETGTLFAKAVVTYSGTLGTINVIAYLNSYGIRSSGLKTYDIAFPLNLWSALDCPSYGCGSETFSIYSTKLDIYVYAANFNPTVTLLTVAVYLQS